MRQLGSFFHIAMNGMAASDKIFRLLDLPEPDRKPRLLPGRRHLNCRDLRFSYEPDREILHGIDLSIFHRELYRPGGRIAAAVNPPSLPS